MRIHRGAGGRIRRGGGHNPGIETPPAPEVPRAPRGAHRHGWLARAGDWLVPGENPAGVVYGIIVIGALMAAESGRDETYAETIGSAMLTAALYWLLHAYANVLGRRLATRGRLTATALWRALAEEWAIVRGAAVPLFALIIAWATQASRETGVTVALWSAVVSLVCFELVAGARSRAGAGEVALEVGIGIAMALAILALRVVLH